jgi:methylmalonyl-CoA/ethylmalonyl-CoA epimerase
MEAKEIDHICFAVRSVEEARKFYEGILGLKPAYEYESAEEGIRVLRYYVGAVAVEIMEPLTKDSDVGKFIEKNGEGFFLISYRVENVETALSQLNSAGIPTIDSTPREVMGYRYAFIQPPKDAHGVLIEIIEGEFDTEQAKKL